MLSFPTDLIVAQFDLVLFMEADGWMGKQKDPQKRLRNVSWSEFAHICCYNFGP